MRFYKVSSTYPYARPGNAVYPCVTLSHDPWDDYGYETTFHLRYYPELGTAKFKHRIKILHKTEKTTPLPESPFFRLDPALYCSLGESLEYYEALSELLLEDRNAILDGLNDIAADPARAKPFTDVEGFHDSLLRFSEAEKAFKEGRRVLEHILVDEQFRFAFSTTVPGASAPHEVEFDFSPDPTGLFRTVALIGRNGTGKTQFLANFAHAMSGLHRGRGRFRTLPEGPLERPSFSKVIAVSYSVFDEFDRPEEDGSVFSYKYCGIRHKERLLSPVEMWHLLGISYDAIVSQRRSETWDRILQTLLGTAFSSEYFEMQAIREEYWRSLSSGQRILTLIMTEIVAHIEKESILLFDEPEIHLHPDVLSALARSLQILLAEFNSYAIIATHSPVLIQEIPRKFVRIFRRTGAIPSVQPLLIQSFGENLTTINDEVFESDQSQNNYRVYLRELASKNDYDAVVGMFEGDLGLTARAYLKSLYPVAD